MIYIHTINHFLNGVGSSQMLCGTPEWKGLCVRVSLARATNNYLIAGGAFSFKLEISHLEFRSSGEKILNLKVRASLCLHAGVENTH